MNDRPSKQQLYNGIVATPLYNGIVATPWRKHPLSLVVCLFILLAGMSGCSIIITSANDSQIVFTRNDDELAADALAIDEDRDLQPSTQRTTPVRTSLPAVENSNVLERPTDEVEQILARLGQEKAVATHLTDGEEFTLPLSALLQHGQHLFTASWTTQDGGGRPLSKGTGAPLSDATHPLVFPNNFNRISGPDANACSGCHNSPYGVPGGGGDIVANVFVLGQRFDFATFDAEDSTPLRGTVDESGEAATLQSIANSRATPGLFGSGYIEMLARQMTIELQALRNTMEPGEAHALVTKGVSFGTLQRNMDGSWDTSAVEGLIPSSLVSTGPLEPPTLVICPFHQASAVISLRQFTNNAFNHHHGIQAAERFGDGIDSDADGVVNELTRADVTAVTLYQATMAVPGRLIPSEPLIAKAIWDGEQLFEQVGCTACHIAELPLDNEGWIYTEPNPFNPPANLQPGDAPTFHLDLSSQELPLPRLQPTEGTVYVPAYTDLKLHDITSNPYDPNVEALDMQNAGTTDSLRAGNSYFITRRLWGVANEPPYFHHGLYTTLREAVLGHAGEAIASRQAYEALSSYEQNALIEFLKSLQVLPPGTPYLFVNEYGEPVTWPPASLAMISPERTQTSVAVR